jgi:predicted RNA-binding Zn-ribbon protein involved in translation (DUF1610 family)
MNAKYADIPILDVARRCGIETDTRTLGKTEVEARCPFCGDKPRGRHLYMNTEKNQYICFLCGEKGNSVSLYARLQGSAFSYGEAAHELLTGNVVYAMPKARESAPLPIADMKSVRERNAVYSAMLTHLELNAAHRTNLRKRGFSDERMELNLYRSLPESFESRFTLAGMLACFYDLSGIPGFYRSKSGEWGISGKSGLLIPVRTGDGLIQGMQIRLDNADAKRKYRWLSSNGRKDGTKCSAFVHVTGDISQNTAYITEGSLKGDAASFLADDDALFVCVPGVNAVRGLPEVLSGLGAKEIVLALDMDRIRNPHVRRAAKNIAASAARITGARVTVKAWDAAYNGIDNYYLSRRAAAA